MPRWTIPIVLAGLCLTAFLVFRCRPAETAPFIVLSPGYRTPVSLRDRIDRCIPTNPGWGWAWRLEQAVFGRRKPLNLNFAILSFAGSSSNVLSSLALGAPSFSGTNGVQAWILAPEELKELPQLLKATLGAEIVSRARISTADGIGCGMFNGQSFLDHGATNPVGLSMDCFARVLGPATDLFASIRLSELVTNEAASSAGSDPLGGVSLRTNMDAAFRLRIPKGNGAFVLQGRPADDAHKRVGIILDPP